MNGENSFTMIHFPAIKSAKGDKFIQTFPSNRVKHKSLKISHSIPEIFNKVCRKCASNES